jgi:tryptophan 2,3-dioxygenase
MTLAPAYDARPLPPLDPTMDASQNHYWSYHSLPALLACKRPLTASQDEDFFIAVHQVCEIAFHQMILDLDRALGAIGSALQAATPVGDTSEACYFLKRVNQLWRTVNTTMPILAGMRAFAEFRTSIGPTSGFQSVQFRRIEIMSGIDAVYWTGGTNDAQGKPHVAETEFDRRHGADVAAWLAAYRETSLAACWRRLLARFPDLAALQANPQAAPLAALMADYDRAQLIFHKLHLKLAVVQLRRVGVEVGTGGTSFRSYLAKYEEALAPLMPELTPAVPEVTEAEVLR